LDGRFARLKRPVVVRLLVVLGYLREDRLPQIVCVALAVISHMQCVPAVMPVNGAGGACPAERLLGLFRLLKADRGL
jgi:hypothetical protein